MSPYPRRHCALLGSHPLVVASARGAGGRAAGRDCSACTTHARDFGAFVPMSSLRGARPAARARSTVPMANGQNSVAPTLSVQNKWFRPCAISDLDPFPGRERSRPRGFGASFSGAGRRPIRSTARSELEAPRPTRLSSSPSGGPIPAVGARSVVHLRAPRAPYLVNA